MMPRIDTIHLFQPLHENLITLLQGLTPGQWELPTIAKQWKVKDVAAHLLDTNIRTLSISRDNYFGVKAGDIVTYEELIDFLNALNAHWVHAMKRVSPQVLTNLLAFTGDQYNKHMSQLDPGAKAIFPVAWAGEEESKNWFHIAREYTEKWHHQQQIRDAISGKDPATSNNPESDRLHFRGDNHSQTYNEIMTREFYHPVLDTFMRALPFTFRTIHQPEGTTVSVTISGDAGGTWNMVKREKWELTVETVPNPDAHTIIGGHVAWKLFTKSWRKDDVRDNIKLEGNTALAATVLEMVSVMA